MDRYIPGSATARGKDRPPPASGHWLDRPVTPLPGSGRPQSDLPPDPAGSTATAGEGRLNSDRSSSGVLAGFVVDPDGRRVPNIFIEVQPANRNSPGAPIGVQTLDTGDFDIQGLIPGQTYQLIARMNRGGVSYAGMTYAKAPNIYVRLQLIEGLELPGGSSGSALDRPQVPPSGSASIPNKSPNGPTPIQPPHRPAPLPQPTTTPPAVPGHERVPADGSWSPLGPKPTPPSTGTPGSSTPRPELITPGPPPEWKPPTATIPSPPLPSVLPGALDRPPGQSQSRTVRNSPDFVLVDTLGRTREFPKNRPGELLLMEFMTTSCLPCKKAIPLLKSWQSRYGTQGLEVIGITCDDLPTSQRRAFASRYHEQHQLNYLLYVEPSEKPGSVMQRFGVEFFPTFVLLDSEGNLLWKGDSRNLPQLDALLEQTFR